MLLLIFIVYVPVLKERGQTGNWIECTGFGHCFEHVVQYESITYAYAGYGAFFQTGVNWYDIMQVMCFGPPVYHCPDPMDCCAFPLRGVVWAIVGLLWILDLLCIVKFFIRYQTA
jgi:hypothetical protein